MTRTDAFLGSAETALALLAREEVLQAWEQPSALTEFRVSGLSGHLASQLFNARLLVGAPPTAVGDAAAQPISVLHHYTHVSWVGDVDNETNRAIRESGEDMARGGHGHLVAEAGAALSDLRELLRDEDLERPVLIPWAGWSLTLEGFLTTRTLELLVHSDDLAVSVGVEPPTFSREAVEAVVDVLTRVALERHGPSAVLRALSRRERAPESIAAI